MGHDSILSQLAAEKAEIRSLVFKTYLQQSATQALYSIMMEEVEQLCGPRHHPLKGEYRRAGSEHGIFYHQGEKHPIRHPRVRRKSGERESEVSLKTYQQARRIENIYEEIMALVGAGVSTRDMRRELSSKAPSKSEVSRLWAQRGAKLLEELRSRPLKRPVLVLQLDGVHLSDELVAIVALGIFEDGEKQVLDFAIGSSENYEVAKELVSRMVRRGLRANGRLFAILDGSQALKKAVLKYFPKAVIQRCLIHKERNIYPHLRRRDHAECARLFKRLRLAQGAEAGREALRDLREFLLCHSASAVKSLDEAGEELISLHLLNVPSTLNKSLLSTNAIENVMKNLRRKTDRVDRWRKDTAMAEHWLAHGLLSLEQGFHKISGHRDLIHLAQRLAHSTSDKEASGDAPCAPSPSASAKGQGATDAEGEEATGAPAKTLTLDKFNNKT